MFLKNIHLKNFRCFDDLYLHFEDGNRIRKNTILLGQNGTGKSNLLKATGLVTAGSNALAELLGNPGSWVKNGKDFCEVSATISTKEKKDQALTLKIGREDYFSQVIERNKESLSYIDREVYTSGKNYFVLALGASRRLAGKSRYKGPENFFDNPRANNVATLFNREANLNSLENWAIDLDYRHDEKGLTIVRNVLKSFLPGVTFHEIDKNSRQLIFKTQDGLVPLELLSDGYQNMASWLGDLLYRVTLGFPEMKDPMKAAGLILIDEIDLHLHPSWQRNLLEFFNTRLPGFQLIATTHSPVTAQQAGKSELYALSRENKNIRLVPFKGTPSELLVNQILMSPVFGLESDESKHVTKLKKDFTRLTARSERTSGAIPGLAKIKVQLSSIKTQRPNSLLSDEDKSLLEEIKNAVSKKTEE